MTLAPQSLFQAVIISTVDSRKGRARLLPNLPGLKYATSCSSDNHGGASPIPAVAW